MPPATPAIQAESSTEIIEAPSQPAAAGLPAVMDPSALIALALEKGAAIDTLERLLAMRDKLRIEAAERAYHDAMAAAQGEFPPIPKTRAVQNRYKYASLDDLMELVTPVLQRHRLSVSFQRNFIKSENGAIAAVSSALIVRHADGHSQTFDPVIMPVDQAAAMNTTQKVGSAMTYADRYAYQGGLGFRPCDEDDDGRGGNGNRNGNGNGGNGSSRPATAPQAARPAQESAPPAQQPATGQQQPSGYPTPGKDGWRLVHIERIASKKTAKGGTQWAVKIAGAPEEDTQGNKIPWPSTFREHLGKMLQTAHDQQCAILIQVKRDRQWLVVEDAQWPPADPTAPKDDPSADDPAMYPAADPAPSGAAPSHTEADLPY